MLHVNNRLDMWTRGRERGSRFGKKPGLWGISTRGSGLELGELRRGTLDNLGLAHDHLRLPPLDNLGLAHDHLRLPPLDNLGLAHDHLRLPAPGRYGRYHQARLERTRHVDRVASSISDSLSLTRMIHGLR
jgi:hypothetical protein